MVTLYIFFLVLQNVMNIFVFFGSVAFYEYKKKGKKAVHSLAPALTLTLALLPLANKLLQHTVWSNIFNQQ